MKMNKEGIKMLRLDECCPVCGSCKLFDDFGDNTGCGSYLGYLECEDCKSKFRYWAAPVDVELLNNDDEVIEEQWINCTNAEIEYA